MMDANALPKVLLIPTQRPQQELMAMDQILGSQGFSPEKQDPGTGKWRFTNAENTARITIRLLAELGVFRLTLAGPAADNAVRMIAGYLPVMSPDAVKAQAERAATNMEKQLFAVILMLTFSTAAEAMEAVGNEMLRDGPDDIRKAVVQGLMLLESGDVGPYLSQIAEDYEGEIGELALKARHMLAERGLLDEPLEDRVAFALEKQADDPELALEDLDKIADTAPESNLVAVARAQVLRALGRLEEALAALETVHADEHAGEALQERALVYEQMGEDEEALADARGALDIDANLEEAQHLVERMQLASEEDDEDSAGRLEKLNAAITKNPDDVGLRIQRAAHHIAMARDAKDRASAQKSYTAALADLNHAGSISDEDPRIPVHRARAELGTGLYISALSSATDAANNAPDRFERQASTLRGLAFLALDEPDRARVAFRHTTQHHPDYPEGWLGLGIAQELLGSEDDARQAYQHAVEHAAEAVENLNPVVFTQLPLWQEIAGPSAIIAPAEKPDSKEGNDDIDPLFKACLNCGAKALGRRTQCRECGGRDFIKG